MVPRLRRHVALAPLSTFHIGGYAESFCAVNNSEDLIETVQWAKRARRPYKILAGGSNVVFPDGKLGGVLIQIRGGKVAFDDSRCAVDAGVELPEVIRQSIARGL